MKEIFITVLDGEQSLKLKPINLVMKTQNGDNEKNFFFAYENSSIIDA